MTSDEVKHESALHREPPFADERDECEFCGVCVLSTGEPCIDRIRAEQAEWEERWNSLTPAQQAAELKMMDEYPGSGIDPTNDWRLPALSADIDDVEVGCWTSDDKGLTCSLGAGHDGDHLAKGFGGIVLSRWRS